MQARNAILSTVALGFLCIAASAARPEEEGQTIRVDVEMVSLPVVVSDRMGKRVLDLQKDDFQVFENGVLQEIAGFAATDEPLKIVLLLDTSGSTENQLARIQNAAIEFVHQLHPDDEVAVASFSEDVRLQSDFSIDRDRNERGIKQTRPGGWTVIYEAVWLALEDILKPVQERKALVVFTDGVDTRSGKANRKETLELAKETRATIYSVCYDTQFDQHRPRMTPGSLPFPVPGYPPVLGAPSPPVIQGGPGTNSADYIQGREYLNQLAEFSGGLVFDGRENLSVAFTEIARELASQYSIGYYSTDQGKKGKFRKVEVKVRKPGLVARTKKGYFPKKETSSKKD